MMYFALNNTANNTIRVFAKDERTAKNIAIRIRHARSLQNLKFMSATVVCDECFPHEGWAVKRLAPGPVRYQAHDGTEWKDCLSGELHIGTNGLHPGKVTR